MKFRFLRAIGVEVLDGWLIDEKTCKRVVSDEHAAQLLQRWGWRCIRIDDDDGQHSEQWQVLPACDLLEVRDGNKVIWSKKEAAR